MLDMMFRASIFLIIDLHSGHHQTRIRLGEMIGSTIQEKERSLYDWLVMLFGLTNGLCTFMGIMTQL